MLCVSFWLQLMKNQHSGYHRGVNEYVVNGRDVDSVDEFVWQKDGERERERDWLGSQMTNTSAASILHQPNRKKNILSSYLSKSFHYSSSSLIRTTPIQSFLFLLFFIITHAVGLPKCARRKSQSCRLDTEFQSDFDASRVVGFQASENKLFNVSSTSTTQPIVLQPPPPSQLLHTNTHTHIHLVSSPWGLRRPSTLLLVLFDKWFVILPLL